MTSDNIKIAYEKYLGMEAPPKLNEKNLIKAIKDKFLRRPRYLQIDDFDRSDMAEQIAEVILQMAKELQE